MDVATSQKTKDRQRSGRNPLSPRIRTDEINWPAGKALVRGWDTSKPTPRIRILASSLRSPNTRRQQLHGWKSDRNDGPTIRSDGRHGRPWRLITNLLSSKDVIDMIDPDDWNPLCINVFIDRIRSNSYLRIDESVREAEFIYPTTLLAISWIREINRVAVARLKARCFINVETKRY